MSDSRLAEEGWLFTWYWSFWWGRYGERGKSKNVKTVSAGVVCKVNQGESPRVAQRWIVMIYRRKIESILDYGKV